MPHKLPELQFGNVEEAEWDGTNHTHTHTHLGSYMGENGFLFFKSHLTICDQFAKVIFSIVCSSQIFLKLF